MEIINKLTHLFFLIFWWSSYSRLCHAFKKISYKVPQMKFMAYTCSSSYIVSKKEEKIKSTQFSMNAMIFSTLKI